MGKICKVGIAYIWESHQYSMYVFKKDSLDLEKTFELFIGDDFAICGWNNDNNLDENGRLEFVIENSNLFYYPLVNFIGDKGIEEIEDDMTLNSYGKKVTFSFDNNRVQIIFEYLKRDSCNEFGINIKNILYDGRSKIDRLGLDTKDRLHNLFRELYKTFEDDKDIDQKCIIKK